MGYALPRETATPVTDVPPDAHCGASEVVAVGQDRRAHVLVGERVAQGQRRRVNRGLAVDPLVAGPAEVRWCRLVDAHAVELVPVRPPDVGDDQLASLRIEPEAVGVPQAV